MNTSISTSDRNMLQSILAAHHVMCLATLGDDGPWSTPVFYAITNHGETLVFMSKGTTLHCRHIAKNCRVSACIFSDSLDIGALHGLQITGVVECPQAESSQNLRQIYFSAYPKARIAQFIQKGHCIYALHIETVTVTDNRLGFGSRLFLDFRRAGDS